MGSGGTEVPFNGGRPQRPIGIEPRFIWMERRRDDLYAAVQRYRDAVMAPEIAWLEELVELEKQIQSRSE